MGLIASLDMYGVGKNLLPHRGSNLGLTARNEWLYQLHYLGPQNPSSRRETYSFSKFLPKIPPVLIWDRTRVSAAKGRQLTARDKL